MAALALTVQLYVDGAWTTYPAYSEEGWSVRIGPDVESGAQPNQLEITLNNDDLSMDPTNAASALFGKIGRNTAARLQISGTTLTAAEASSWKPERSIEHVPGAGRGRSAIGLTAEGLLRRLGRWDDPIDSPMRRQTGSYTSLTGYWPLEDASGAAQLLQVVDKAGTGYYSGTVTLAGDDGPGGSDKCVKLGSDGQIGGRFLVPSGNGYQICVAVKLSALPSSGTNLPIFTWADTAGRTWRWQVSNTGFLIDVTDADGTAVSNISSGFGTGASPNQWLRYRVKVTVSGGTVTYEPAWYPQDASVIFGVTNTFASSTAGRVTRWSASGNAWTDGAAYAHMFGVSDTTVDLTGGYDAVAAFNGYLYERAGFRFARLMAEQGLIGWVLGNAAKSAPMGRQKPGKLLDLLELCATTDNALLYDDPGDASGQVVASFRCYNDLINKTPAMALTYGVDLAPPLKKLIDDVKVINDMTGTNADGSEVRIERTTGRLSTSPPPAGVGRYKGSIDVNLASAAAHLTDRTNLELAENCVDRPRYDKVTIDLLAQPGLRSAVNGLRPGEFITLAGVEADTITLRVLTIERRGGPVQEIVSLTCLPADIYQVPVYDSSSRLADSNSTTLAAGVSSSATLLVFATAVYGDVWSVNAPYDVMIAGQRNTVLGMSLADSVAIVDGTFELGSVGTWSVTGGTLDPSTAQAHRGSWSALLTVSGSPPNALIRDHTTVAASPGQTFTARMWVRCSVARNVLAVIDFYNGASYLSSAFNTVAVTANTWTEITVSGTAPASTTRLEYGPTMDASPANGTTLYIDDIDIIRTDLQTGRQLATVTRGVNNITKALAAGEEIHVFKRGYYAFGTL